MSDVFQILADPTRRRLVDALRNGGRSVGELVDVVDIGQPGVSRQLGILEDARFVVVRPEGRRRLYALRPEPFRELDDWMTRDVGGPPRPICCRARPAGQDTPEKQGGREMTQVTSQSTTVASKTMVQSVRPCLTFKERGEEAVNFY